MRRDPKEENFDYVMIVVNNKNFGTEAPDFLYVAISWRIMCFLISLTAKISHYQSSSASYKLLVWHRKQPLSILCSDLFSNHKLQKTFILQLVEIYNSSPYLLPWNFSTILNCKMLRYYLVVSILLFPKLCLCNPNI